MTLTEIREEMLELMGVVEVFRWVHDTRAVQLEDDGAFPERSTVTQSMMESGASYLLGMLLGRMNKLCTEMEQYQERDEESDEKPDRSHDREKLEQEMAEVIQRTAARQSKEKAQPGNESFAPASPNEAAGCRRCCCQSADHTDADQEEAP